jgi:hypothetical protein
LLFKSKDYLLEFSYGKKIKSKAHVIEFRDKQFCIIEATHRIDPTEYTDDIYPEISKICETKSVYVDLSRLYGIECNSWLMKWEFIVDSKGHLLDERFHVMKDLVNIDKDEYIILKEYINNKQDELLIYQ